MSFCSWNRNYLELFYYNNPNFKWENIIVYLIIVYKIRVMFSLSCSSWAWRKPQLEKVSYCLKFISIFLMSVLPISMVKNIWEYGTILCISTFKIPMHFFTLKQTHTDSIYVCIYSCTFHINYYTHIHVSNNKILWMVKNEGDNVTSSP